MKTKILNIVAGQASYDERLVHSLEELDKVVKLLKDQGKKVVLTQGVFDLIHIGHVRYLDKAKSYGDVLIVGVDTDALTKKRKGPKRPFVPEDERLQILGHLRPVDLLVRRDNFENMDDLVELVKPDVLVVSETTKDISDFTEKMKARLGHCCGEIIALEPQATTSTTARIRTLALDGGKELAEKVQVFIKEYLKSEEKGGIS